jgi:hypothetical protein
MDNITACSTFDTLLEDIPGNNSGIFFITYLEKQLKSEDISGSKLTITNYLHSFIDAFFVFSDKKWKPALSGIKLARLHFV